jgi:hypothetical protein
MKAREKIEGIGHINGWNSNIIQFLCSSIEVQISKVLVDDFIGMISKYQENPYCPSPRKSRGNDN